MKTAKVTITGTSPLLMHQYPMEPVEAIEKKPKEEQAEVSAYRDPDSGNLYIPARCMLRALVSAACYSKGKARGTLSKIAAACVQVEPQRLDLNEKDYEIDSQPVVIKATGGRILRHRPRLDEWSVSFEYSWHESLLTEVQARRILDDCGTLVGILDFRPEKKGPYGKFMVTKWEIMK